MIDRRIYDGSLKGICSPFFLVRAAMDDLCVGVDATKLFVLAGGAQGRVRG